MRYKTQGTCSRYIEYDVKDGRVYNVRFIGGCSGNTRGIAALVEGMKIEEVIDKLRGIRCGYRATSCPDQFAKALSQRIEE